MSKYHLTEAYGNLYNPRKADETFYENLRFVDYLMQEEIEEVMESLLWEFMDYGNTLDESYDLIEGVFSDDVILEEALYEARMSPRQKAERAARVGGERQAALGQIAGEKAQARKEARKAALTGALRAAKETVGKIATGVRDAAVGGYRGAKRMAGTAYTATRQGAGEAKAGLQKLVRKGAMAAGSKGRAMEKAGKQARMQAQTAAGGASYSGSSALERSRARTAGLEAAGKTGSKRQAIGRLLRQAGAMVGRAVGRGSSGNKPMTRADLAANNARRADAARQAVGDPFGSSSGTTSAPKTPASSPRKYPTEPSGQTTLFTKPVPAKSAGADVKVPSGGQRKFGATRKPKKSGRQMPLNLRRAGYSEPKVQKEDFELLAQYIMEDFINEGYADTYEEALEILENLSESSIVELTEMYLEG